MAGELVGIFIKIESCHGFHTIDAVAHLHGVEIHFHDPLLAPNKFYQHREICLKTFPHPTVTWPQKHIFGGLLRYGAGAPLLSSAEGLKSGLVDFLKVETVVLQKACVFARHHRQGHVLADSVDTHPFVLYFWLTAVGHLLHHTNKHQRSVVHWQPLQYHHRRHGGNQKEDNRKRYPAKYASNDIHVFFEKLDVRN